MELSIMVKHVFVDFVEVLNFMQSIRKSKLHKIW